MSLLTSDLAASPLTGPETNASGFNFAPNSPGEAVPFGEVFATLQVQPGSPANLQGQTLAAAGPAGPLDWAPALTVEALGEHLQLITPGEGATAEGSLADFARSQGLDDITIGWLMGQAPEAATGAATTSSPLTGLLALKGSDHGLAPVTASNAPPNPLTAPTDAGLLAHSLENSLAPTLAGARLASGALGAGADFKAMVLPQTPEGTAPASDAPGAEGPPAAGTGTLTGTGLPGGTGQTPGQGTATATAGLAALSATAGALWTDLTRPANATAAKSSEGASLRAEPTESLMATLRTPAATALMGLQRSLQTSAGAPAALQAGKTASSLRVSDLDLSQSLGPEGPDLQSLLTEWSSRLDSPSASDAGHAPALAAIRGQGAMASSPLGLLPQGGEPQLGIDLADKFEQMAEKMGQAVAQRMLSEIEKGHWHLKLMLRPATLGHIEVEMRMRSGELDASFVASQNLTRELLQESLPRLRETLTQLGMDVANMNVDSGRSQQGDGEPTPHAPATQAKAGATAPQADTNVITPPPTGRRGQEGWDVMV